jgi:hypothetical protein
MSSPETPVPDEELPERHRIFLQRLREHDHRVKVFRSGDKAVFHGPIIGDGPMPSDNPGVDEPEEGES